MSLVSPDELASTENLLMNTNFIVSDSFPTATCNNILTSTVILLSIELQFKLIKLKFFEHGFK